MTRLPVFPLLVLLLAPATVFAQEIDALPYRNSELPIDERVDDLLARMTLEEKVAQMLSIYGGKRAFTDAEGRFDPAGADVLDLGIGRIERPSDGHGAREQAEFTNAIQEYLISNTRLGIPAIFHEEALHGLQGQEATSFPQAIALAGTWDMDLVRRIYAATAAEIRARGAQQVLTPVVDVAREPRWGRIEETPGEDPFLTAEFGIAAVRGFQGDGPLIHEPHVIATLKHMTGHGQPESGTNIGPANPRAGSPP